MSETHQESESLNLSDRFPDLWFTGVIARSRCGLCQKAFQANLPRQAIIHSPLRGASCEAVFHVDCLSEYLMVEHARIAPGVPRCTVCGEFVPDRSQWCLQEELCKPARPFDAVDEFEDACCIDSVSSDDDERQCSNDKAPRTTRQKHHTHDIRDGSRLVLAESTSSQDRSVSEQRKARSIEDCRPTSIKYRRKCYFPVPKTVIMNTQPCGGSAFLPRSRLSG